ncbi:hypothetical protein BZK31_23210 [Pseudomonas floridensis]|uniref:Uncharacterized protein n=1 Tax=Pseudomonas floridensis TaxID=1958950 RepID=A0A1X0MZZ9_9PSED|nr:hypothetical protein [Pseudomonas floridensis]ORC56335.1 hypothetical protein BZK31_23210 [Pseudomonas floridensis]
MATAILYSIKQGAYIAIALYVVFIAVVTVTSMNPHFGSPTRSAPEASWVDVKQPVTVVQERAS